MKKEYKRPTIEVLEMEVQQMICQSPEFTQKLSDESEDGSGDTAWPEYNSVFD